MTQGGRTEATERRFARERPRRGDRLELTIEDLAHGGAGVARLDGYVVFVDGGLPGDVVRAEIFKARRAYANARAVEVLEPSEDRVPGRCDHAGEACPGSPWQELRYERQLEHKQRQVDDALTRLGGLSKYELEPIVPAADIWRYRNKLEYSFGPGLALGFHARGQWERVVEARDCVLASERSNEMRNLVRDWCDREGLSPYDRRDGTGFLRNLVVREGRRTGALQLRLVTSDADFRAQELAAAIRSRFPDASFLWTRTEALAEVSHGGVTEVVAGSTRLEEELLGLRFRISPDAFFQTNTEMAERLYELASDYAGLEGRERVFDLFCGIGTLSLVLALRTAEVWGVDIAEQAIADAIDNARRNEVDNTRFFAGDARTAIEPLAQQAQRPDVVVVDPPRAGLSKKVVRRLLETRPKRIVYVSCNPTTLAPNARQIVDAGFRLAKVRAVDMFPHTPHIECVALLEHEPDGVAAGGELMTHGRERGFGIAAGLDPEVLRELADRCARLRYRSLWSNDHPMASGLETVAQFAAAAPELEIGVAVLALDRHTPTDIGARIAELGLDPARLWIGIGSGFTKRPLGVVREGLAALRTAIPDGRVVVAAMGPKMCALAGAEADGAFLNWMTPERAAWAREQVHEGARNAGHEPPPVFGYVRVAVGADAHERLLKEESFYRELHQGYQRHFAALGAEPGSIGVAATDPAQVEPELARYEAIDHLVVRALAHADAESLGGVADAAAPR